MKKAMHLIRLGLLGSFVLNASASFAAPGSDLGFHPEVAQPYGRTSVFISPNVESEVLYTICNFGVTAETGPFWSILEAKKFGESEPLYFYAQSESIPAWTCAELSFTVNLPSGMWDLTAGLDYAQSTNDISYVNNSFGPINKNVW